MSAASAIFGRDRALVGMIHVRALPGTPRGGATIEAIARHAVDEAQLLVDAGFDALIIENMHDAPYLRRDVGPEIVASMTAVTAAVRDAVDVPLGVQVLAGANRAALAVALAAGATFVRAEGFVFASVADEGLLDEADAAPLLRARRALGAEHIRILADVKKKHSSHAITGDVDLTETVRAAVFSGADGVIVTGDATGSATAPDDVRTARAATDLPVVVGSGVTAASAPGLLEHADALVVGSFTKTDGHWANPVDPDRARAVTAAVRGSASRPAAG